MQIELSRADLCLTLLEQLLRETLGLRRGTGLSIQSHDPLRHVLALREHGRIGNHRRELDLRVALGELVVDRVPSLRGTEHDHATAGVTDLLKFMKASQQLLALDLGIRVTFNLNIIANDNISVTTSDLTGDTTSKH